MPLRHAIFVLSYKPSAPVRNARGGSYKFRQGSGAPHCSSYRRRDTRSAQGRFPTVKCDDRPMFLPNNVLNVLRIVLTHCSPTPPPAVEEDESVRYSIGRACLIMNSLLFTRDEGRALLSGTEDDRRTELMTQMIAGFELANSPRATHLMPDFK